MRYLLDTNILLLYLREDEIAIEIEANYQILDNNNLAFISVVSKGELKALALRNKWGNKRMRKLDTFLDLFLIVDINAEDIIDKYAEIDAFSQGKLASYPSPLSARNMGKNDIWIAATTSVLEAQLITTDKDFEHLDEVFLNLLLIER
ncbi:MAG: type II toxin-antitoxin system VapC family toxin [Chitinophagales bacterium]